MKIASLIKTHRTQLNETQETYGKRCGVHGVAVSLWESGSREAPYRVIESVFEGLMQLELEKQMRCGDGTGKIPSHSANCLCDEINTKIKSLKREFESKPDTTRALPQYPNKAEQTISDGVAYKTPSSERLKEEYREFINSLGGNIYYQDENKTFVSCPEDIWNWILSHAREIGGAR